MSTILLATSTRLRRAVIPAAIRDRGRSAAVLYPQLRLRAAPRAPRSRARRRPSGPRARGRSSGRGRVRWGGGRTRCESRAPARPAGRGRTGTSDGPAGVRGERWDERDTSANVPSPTALAATWDEARVERLGDLLAAECRRKGVDVLLAPTVNLHRTPYGGRHFECFSEDPLLTARIGVAYVRGLQNQGVGATVKHFVCNDSETERMSVDIRIDERTLRELYL